MLIRTSTFALAVLTVSAAWAEPLILSIDTAEVGESLVTEEPVIRVRLSDESTTAFGEFTERNIGLQVEIRVDGTVVSAPVIRESIFGGYVEITGFNEAEDATGVAERMTTDGVTVEVEVLGD
ncbi:SecDF P1 head subdomain-containing protein [Bauldia sp.]|uniref:SecDF P1 head subdomain-containing protein n=1 Tax=Bauldia sp. TaxID=2575872 RepID=UPI003BAB971B